MPQEISAGIVVYHKTDGKIEYLVLHYGSGHWDFPKGHIEDKESLKETAIRETKEETALDININDDFEKSITYFYRKEGVLVSKIVYFFLGESKSKAVKISKEHTGYEWLSYEDALDMLTFDNAKEVLKKAGEFLTQKTLEDF